MTKLAHPQSNTQHGEVYRLKQKLEPFYKNIGIIRCPVIKSSVIFNNHGWKHIRFDGKGHKRPTASIIMRFNLLPHVPEIVKNTKNLIKESNGIVTIKGSQRNVKYYEIAEECDGGNKHITVILRKIEAEPIHFISVRRTSEKVKRSLKTQKNP